LSTKVTPVGSVPVSVIVGDGSPVVVTVNVPAEPTVKVVLAADVIVGGTGAVTVSVKSCVAFGFTPLLAVMTIEYGLLVALPAAGVPESRPAELRVTPVGRAPVSLKVGVGLPDAVTVNVPAEPTVKVVESAEVIVGAVGVVVTDRVNDWVAFGVIPLLAVMVNVYEGFAPMIGVPDSRPEVLRVTPLGSAPVSVNEDAGKPLAVTWKLPEVPITNDVESADVMAGA
jgi:hypothetical protein